MLWQVKKKEEYSLYLIFGRQRHLDLKTKYFFCNFAWIQTQVLDLNGKEKISRKRKHHQCFSFPFSYFTTSLVVVPWCQTSFFCDKLFWLICSAFAVKTDLLCIFFTALYLNIHIINTKQFGRASRGQPSKFQFSREGEEKYLLTLRMFSIQRLLSRWSVLTENGSPFYTFFVCFIQLCK